MINPLTRFQYKCLVFCHRSPLWLGQHPCLFPSAPNVLPPLLLFLHLRNPRSAAPPHSRTAAPTWLMRRHLNMLMQRWRTHSGGGRTREIARQAVGGRHHDDRVTRQLACGVVVGIASALRWGPMRAVWDPPSTTAELAPLVRRQAEPLASAQPARVQWPMLSSAQGRHHRQTSALPRDPNDVHLCFLCSLTRHGYYYHPAPLTQQPPLVLPGLLSMVGDVLEFLTRNEHEHAGHGWRCLNT